MHDRSIAVDGRNLMHPLGGSGSYLIAAINELSRLQPTWLFHILTSRPLHPDCAERIVWRTNVRHLCKARTPIGLLWYCTELYGILKRLKPDFFWAPATLLPPILPADIKTIVTVNDLVAKEYRSTMAPINRFYSDLMFDRSIKAADILLAISHYTANEVVSHYPERKSQTIEIGCAIDQSVFIPLELATDECNKIAGRYGVATPFLLFVGTIEPRKNLAFMLNLMPRLAEHGLWLLVVGAQGWGNSRLVEISRVAGFPQERVRFAGHVPTGELVKLYNAASVYVSTSYNEGFGLPQLEAMNCGCPVVSPHNSGMVEVVEGAGLTVKGWDVDTWCTAILSVLTHREQYRALGIVRSKQYQWPAVANTIVRSIEALEAANMKY